MDSLPSARPEGDWRLVATFGPIAFATLAVVIGTLIVAASRRIVDRRWLRVVGMLVLAGFLSALIGRTASAISSVRIRASARRTEVLADVSLPGHA